MSSQATDVQAVAQPAGSVEASPRLRKHRRFDALLFTLPAFLTQLIWGWYLLLFAFIISFTDAQPILPSKFTGLESYIRIVRDPLVVKSFGVTFVYGAMSIVLTFIIPIFVAILLMEMPPRTMRWMMLLWFLPISPIASTILWKYLYNTQYGLFEYIATSMLHLPTQQFLNDPNQVLFWLVFPGFLLFGPGLIYMASLQGVPGSYYEAAEVEGAGFWRKIWTISLPRLRPIISMMLTFTIIATLQEFAWPQIMTQGQPGGSSMTIVMYMYGLINNQSRYSDATALAILLFIIIMVIIIAFRSVYREDPDI